MNKEEPYRDHAEKLKQRIDKINDKKPRAVREQLPPREEVHREKRQKTKWKVKYPVIRMLVLSFILLPIIIFSIYTYLEGGKNGGTMKTGGNSSNYETINFEKSSPENIEGINDKEDKMQKEDEMSEIPLEHEKKTVEVLQPTNSNTIRIPSGQGTDKNSGTEDESKEPITSQPEPSTPTTKIISHTVKPGETLFRIAMNYYHSKDGVTIIMEANNLNSEQINVGQVLNIPLEK